MKVIGVIFANDGLLDSLTDNRATAALPFGGRYRQVDFALSNFASAGIHRVGIISRHNYQSTMNHIGSGEEWGLELEEGGLEFLTPYATSTTDNYRGKLESLHSAMGFLNYGSEEEYVIMTGSAILCNIDLTKVLESHIASGKDITVVTKSGIADGKRQVDMALKLDEKGNITDIAVDYAADESYVASMDIFVASKNWLIRQLNEHIARNLYHMDRDLVMGQWHKGTISVNVYPFKGVALYNESVEDYYRNNLALIREKIRHDLFGHNHPVFTKVRDRVPGYYGENCRIDNCVVADGCVMEGEVKDSVLFRQVTIGAGAKVESCLIMNDTVIGEDCELKCVILDKDVVVRPGAKLVGTPTNPVIIKRGEIV